MKTTIRRHRNFDGDLYITITNPLGLVLANVYDNETTLFQPVTKQEFEYIEWVVSNYDRLIDNIIED